MNEFINRYFKRLGLDYSEVPPLGADLLNRIQYAHVTRIPYENIDIINGLPLKLDADSLFEKMIVNGRGGYCFELNCLYARLLTELGFKVESYMARFLRNETEIPMRRHRVLLASCPGRETFLCDAGVGTIAPRHPIPFRFLEEFRQFGETYRLRTDGFYGTVLEELYKGEWRDMFGFTAEKQLDIDYVMPSFYCEKHPDSIFNKDLMIAIKTKTGRKTIDGNVYKEFESEEIIFIKELAPNEITGCLGEEFGLKFT
ncbi:MAG: arylamine N-acetyltransferase [Oscillospiraceae bacterium]|nr:arylamine N-acetyltransferase [Oscillospiraceae bacterium]